MRLYFFSPIIYIYIPGIYFKGLFHLRVSQCAWIVIFFFFFSEGHPAPNALAAQRVISREADSPHKSIISHLFMFLPVWQIECSSISEYSERIIKSNHLDSGKICSCLGTHHSNGGVPYPADKHGLEDEGGVDGRTLPRTEIGRTGGAHRFTLKCTI